MAASMFGAAYSVPRGRPKYGGRKEFCSHSFLAVVDSVYCCFVVKCSFPNFKVRPFTN